MLGIADYGHTHSVMRPRTVVGAHHVDDPTPEVDLDVDTLVPECHLTR
jgi:hypothetical protein